MFYIFKTLFVSYIMKSTKWIIDTYCKFQLLPFSSPQIAQ